MSSSNKKSKPGVPSLNFQPEKDRLLLVEEEYKEDLKGIKELYEESSEADACRMLMSDIIVVISSKVGNLPTSPKTKAACIAKYIDLTGKSRGASGTAFEKALKLQKGINIGIVANHAAAVAQDVVQRQYEDLLVVDEAIEEITRQIEDIDPDSKQELDLDKRAKLTSKKVNLVLRKNNIYKQLSDYAKDFGADLAMKDARNQIEDRKVDVLENKAKSDSDWQKMDIALRLDGDYEDKLQVIANAISQDRELTSMIESQMEADDFSAEILEEEETNEM